MFIDTLVFLAERWSVSLAILFTFLSVISGFMGITKQSIWTQPDGLKPYAQGDARAWLFFLVNVSTILSLAHLGLLVDWAASNGRDLIGGGYTDLWNMWHGFCSLYFTIIHVIIIRFREIREALDKRELLTGEPGVIETLSRDEIEKA